MYPRYLFVSDLILQKNIDGINNVNIVDFIYNNNTLKWFYSKKKENLQKM